MIQLVLLVHLLVLRVLTTKSMKPGTHFPLRFISINKGAVSQ